MTIVTPTGIAGINSITSLVNDITFSTASGGSLTANGLSFSSINGGPLAGTRNRIINGDMRIDQRFAGTSALFGAGSAYVLDRWFGVATIANRMRVQQVTDAPAGFSNSQKFSADANSTIGATDHFVIIQRVEGFNASDLSFGTASAVSITVSFWVKASATGTYGGSIRNASFNRSYPFTYSIAAANTWEKKFVTIPGDTAGTWGTGNGIGLDLIFDLGVGSTFRGTAGSWSGSNFIGATGATSILATSGASWHFTGVQLEAGTVATPFERRSFGQELALCQRYYESGGTFTTGTTASNALGRANICFAVQKRSSPTLGITVVAGQNSSNFSLPYVSTSGFVAAAAGAAVGDHTFFNYTAAAELP
jgi:hypothetical protein